MKDYLVFGYVRVSTENQLENYSVDEQTVRITSYCKAKGWTLLHTYIDGGFSGGNTDRPALQTMLAAIRRREADAVVVYKLDRLSRSQKDTLTLIEDELLANNTDFVSINENFDTSSPFGRAMIGILSVFAQLEKDQITERFTMGRMGRSKAGYYHGGPTPPTGYAYVDGKLIADPVGALQVRQIFDLFTAGASINAIFQQLQGTFGGSWSAAKIANILRNSAYIGKVKFAGSEYAGVHQPLVPAEQFESVQQLLAKRVAPIKQPFRAEYLLSGLVVCARCGARYSANHGDYKCYSRAKSCKRFVKDPNCKNDNWKICDLDEYTVHSVKSLCGNQKAIAALIAEKAEGRIKGPNRMEIEKKLASLEKQMEKLVELYQFSAIPMETLTKKVLTIRSERAALLGQLEEKAIAMKPFQVRIAGFQESFDAAAEETKRLLIASLIEEISIDGPTVVLSWRI